MTCPLRATVFSDGSFFFYLRTAISDVFATSSPKDQLVFLCVRIQPNQSPYIETIVNADFGSKRSSDGVRNENLQWTQVIIGQNQHIDGTITTDFPFYGRISNLNIWFHPFTDDHITTWFNSGPKHYKPNILKWPDLGSSSKRIGDVHFVKVTSAERRKLNWLDTLPYCTKCKVQFIQEEWMMRGGEQESATGHPTFFRWVVAQRRATVHC